MTGYLLAIDQGTTSSRAILFDLRGNVVLTRQKAFKQFFPAEGSVEHDPEEIWQSVLEVSSACIQAAPGGCEQIKAIGITNQRETTLVWDKATGKAVYPAIVWQDRRTADFCREHQSEGNQRFVADRTGLLLDPYFSASKLAWILDHVPNGREKAAKGDYLFGTVDSFLVWRLSQGKTHITDITNASRTLLFNIHTQDWDEELLRFFNIPKQMLPTVTECAGELAICDPKWFGLPIPISGIAGDQQAATIGQAAVLPGGLKATYGTGCFAVLNIGEKPVLSKHRLLTTVLSRVQGKTMYALEGSIFVAGAAMSWLHEGMALIEDPKQSDAMARSLESNEGVYFVPALTGLGAPYWDPYARGALLGLTRDTTRAHVVRATLEAIAYQTKDLWEAFRQDYGQPITQLKVDGGMVKNNWMLQFLSDMLSCQVDRPKVIETTASGAAFLAGLGLGLFTEITDIHKFWQLDTHFTPDMAQPQRDKLYRQWQTAVKAVLLHAEGVANESHRR